MKISENSVFWYLRFALALIYIWFGALKFFPDYSPAEGLARNTIDQLFFSIFSKHWSVSILAAWECAIGITLLFNKTMQVATIAGLVHIAFTFTPLFLFPELCFTNPPIAFTIIGQYIVKNLLFVGIFLLLYLKSKNDS